MSASNLARPRSIRRIGQSMTPRLSQIPVAGWSKDCPAWFLTGDAPAILDYRYALPMPACQERPFFVAMAVLDWHRMLCAVGATWARAWCLDYVKTTLRNANDRGARLRFNVG